MKKTNSIPVRLEHDMVQKLDKLATQHFNSRAGMIRMGVALLIQSMEAAEVKPQEPAAEPAAA